LLSDEFGAFDPADRVFHALLKPVALKNDSISLIRDFSSEACFGPEFPKTRKGTVAHLAATRDSVERRRDPSPAGAIVLPRWRAGSRTRFEPVEQRAIFGALAFNSFNYSMLGATGFDAVMHLARSCPAWQLIYSDLDEAVAAVDGIWPEVVAGHLATDSARP
jgi:HprK-related kinase A